MLLTNNRDGHRELFFVVWQKQQASETLSALEQQLWHIIAAHPEYHPIFTHKERYLARDYIPEQGEANPFLHMGLHMAITEQLQTNRPQGIRTVYQTLCKQLQDAHAAEHKMADCLMESLWQAQRHQKMPDEQAYLKALKCLTL